LAEIHVVCNNSKLDSDWLFPAGRPEAKRGQAPGERQGLGFPKVGNEKDGSGENPKDHNFHVGVLTMSRPTLGTLSATRCSKRI